MAIEWERLAFAYEAVPTGGTEGQVLAKASDTNFDVEWVDSGTAPITSLFELDTDDGLMPIATTESDQYFELDSNDDLMPKEA